MMFVREPMTNFGAGTPTGYTIHVEKMGESCYAVAPKHHDAAVGQIAEAVVVIVRVVVIAAIRLDLGACKALGHEPPTRFLGAGVPRKAVMAWVVEVGRPVRSRRDWALGAWRIWR